MAVAELRKSSLEPVMCKEGETAIRRSGRAHAKEQKRIPRGRGGGKWRRPLWTGLKAEGPEGL